MITTTGSIKKGAVEIHEVYVKKWAAEYVREQLGVPYCLSLIRLDEEIRRQGEEPKRETRYYMSSLDPDKISASEFQEYILRHWEVGSVILRRQV